MNVGAGVIANKGDTMKAFEVIFRSGVARILYGKTKDEALESLWEGAQVDCVTEIKVSLEREREFKQEHAPLFQASAVLQAMQELKTKEAMRNAAKSHGFIKDPSTLSLPQP